MTAVASFIANPLPLAPSRLRAPPRHSRQRLSFLATANTPDAVTKRPDAGLISKRGVTGTLCANLWPLPILGGYSWFLNVYDREVAASVGPFVVNCSDDGLHMEFQPEEKPQSSDKGESHHAFAGIVAGNINVRKAVKQIGKGSAYQLKLFEKGGSENLLQRRNEVHAVSVADPVPEGEVDFWRDPAPTFRIVSRASTYEVREVYAGGGASPRATSPLEYFAMNLSPVFPFAKYSCFVCVWRQRPGISPVAIDKRDQSLNLSFFDPLEIPEGKSENDAPPATARFAVKVFFGGVTDDTVASQHKMLVDALASSPSTRALSETDFRVVVDNTPGTVTPNRRNEMWVQVA